MTTRAQQAIQLTRARDQLYLDVFTTALEGGIGYWSRCSDYHWTKTPGGEPDFRGFRALITDSEDDDKAYVINRPVIERGFSRIIDGEVGVGSWIRQAVWLANAELDACPIDSTVADCIVQAGLLGEVVYG